MKKRIISLLLVFVLAVGVLTSCGYSYEKDDLTGCTDFSLSAFKTALEGLTIEDGDYADVGDNRAEKLAEKIDAALATAVVKDTASKKTAGTIGTNSVLEYCYYYTAEIADATHYFSYGTMKEASAVKENMFAKEDLGKKIADVLVSKDIAPLLYSNKSGKAADGDTVFLTYSYNYTKTDKTVVNGKVASQPFKLTKGEELSDKIIDLKSAGDSVDAFTTTNDVRYEGESVSYTGMKVDFIAPTDAFENHGSIVTDTTYTDTKNVEDVYGEKCDLKDKELTYYVYPVAFYELPELTARVVLETLLAKDIKADSLACFADTDTYKYNDGSKDITLKSVIEKLVADIADKDKTPDYDAVMAEIDKMTGAADKIVEDYKKTQEDALLSSYRSEIKDNLAGAIWEIIEAINVKTLPERAVKDAYEQNYKAYKYDYYTGKYNGDSEMTNREFYTSLDDFIIKSAAGLSATATIAEAEKKLRENAEEEVRELVKLFAVAKAYDIKVSNTDVENYVAIYVQYSSLFFGKAMSQSQVIDMYGENNIRAALTLNKLLDHLLETDEHDPDKYLNLKYTIAEEN